MGGIYIYSHSWVYKREQCHLLLGHMDLTTLYLMLGWVFKSFTTVLLKFYSSAQFEYLSAFPGRRTRKHF